MYPKIFVLKSYNLLLVIITLTIFLSTSLEAANYYWTAQDDGGTKNWSHSQNWSNASGNSISGYPDGTRDNAIFQADAANVTVDRYVRIGKITIKNAYTGTINLNGNILNPTRGFAQYNGTILIPANSDFRVHGGAAVLYDGATITSQGDDSNLKIQHNLIFYNGSIINAPNSNSAFEVRGGFRNEGGTFNHNSGTLIMNTKNNWGEAMFKVTGTGSLYNIDFRGNVNKRIYTDITVDNNLYIRGNGDLIGGTSSSGKNITIKGDWWQQSGKNNFTHANGTVTFSGSSSQNITSNNNFRNVIINNVSGVSLVNDLTNITSTLTINSGSTFDINGQDLTAVTLVNNGNLQLLGSETVNITTMDTDTGTVTYDGSGATGLAAGDNYFNLIFNQSGTSTLDANLDVNGSVSISSGTLDASTSNYNINVAGNWTNGDIFNSRSGTVTFDGTSTITSGGITNNTQDFYNVILSGSAGTQSTNHVDVDNDFTISSSGTWNTSGLCLFVAGTTTTGSGTLTNTTLPTVTFDPANSDNDVQPSENITLTFNHAMQNTDDSALTNTNVDSLISLKVNNSSGADIAFNATIDSDKKVITINPDSNLTGEQNVYVAIGATVEDQTCGQAITAANATFTVVDTDVPTLSSSTPADADTGVGVNDNIILNFSKAVDAESGNIVIYKASDDSEVESIPVGNAKVSGSGSTQITINPASTLDSSTNYYVQIAAAAFDDSSSNSYAGINDKTSLNFTTADVNAPTLSSSTPADEATGIAVDTNIVLNFNEAVDAESGNIIIYKSSDDSQVESIPVGDAKVSGSSSTTITINPLTSLNGSTAYYVHVAATAFDDSSSNSYAGISDATTLNFTTADIGAPTLSSSTPADGATGIAVDTNIVLTFNEAVDAENGNIIIVKSVDGSTVEAIDVTGSQVSGSGSTEITINPSVNLDGQTAYHLTIDETAFDDSSSNSYAGISDTTTINFTTADVTAPTVTFNPADSDTGVGRDSNINIEFNEAIVNANTSEITNSNIASLIILKDSNSNGSDLAFSATIDTDKKIITIDPNNNFSLGQTVYVSISAVEDASANETSLSSSTFTVTTTGETIATIIPADSSRDVLASSNITIGFNTAIRNLNDTEITNDNIHSLITLKDTDTNGTDIPFTISINTAKKIITINPISDLSSGQNIYVAIGVTVEDVFDNATTAASSIFTIVDNAVPIFTFNPADLDRNVIVSSNIIITFNELIRNINNSTLIDSNVDNLITLKDEDSSGSNITFNATIDEAKKIITINPTNNFNSEQVIYLAIAAVEDEAGNATAATNISFTARDSDPPAVSFFPSNSDINVLRNSDITISFTEVIRNLNDTPITDANIDSLITLKQSNSSGADILFDAVVDPTKENITITPTSNLPLNQVIYVAIGASVEDEWDNAITASSASFTTIDDRLSVTFDPADGTTGLPVNTNVIMTFSDAIRHLDDSLITSANVDDLITLEYSFSGSPIPFDATIDTAKKIITINPTNNLIPGDIIYVSIDSVENSSDVATGLAAGTFSVDDTIPPNVLISPSNGSTNIEADAIITIYFDEEIRLLNNTSITNINVDSLITLRVTNSNGADIAFDATIDIHNQLISINLNENLASEQAVYISIGPTVEDSYDNATSTTSSVFSTGDSIPPSVSIDAVLTVSEGGE